MTAKIDDTNTFQRPFELCHVRHSYLSHAPR
jgi:hypothetical protein